MKTDNTESRVGANCPIAHMVHVQNYCTHHITDM